MDRVRRILESDVLLVYPDFSKKLFVGTDASQYGLGAVLYQQDDNGNKQYVKFASRSLRDSERNYGAPQRELLGVLFALNKFHDYLYGRRFTLYTDHQSLTYLLKKPNLAPTLRNWLGEIMEYDFDIIHLPGLENHLPDALSRLYESDDNVVEDRNEMVMAIIVDNELHLENAPAGSGLRPGVYSETLEELEIVDDQSLRIDIMNRAHAGFHEGAAGMARQIRAVLKLTWPNLEKECQDYVKRCLQCQRFNVGRHGYHPPKSMVALFPFDHICIDLKEMPQSDSGSNYYLLVIDVATRFVFLRPLVDKTAYAVAQELYKIFTDIGFPKMVQSDNGKEFVNEIMASVKALANVMERLIAPYSHKSNGMAEKTIGVTSNAIWKSLQGRVSNWDKLLPAVQFNYNNRVVDIHGSTPYSLVFARRANEFFDYSKLDLKEEDKRDREQRLIFLNSIVFPELKEKVKKHLRKRNEYFVKTHRMAKSDFLDGSYVMLKVDDKGPKYKAKYEGPFMVMGREASGAYRIRGIDGTEYVRSPDMMKLVEPEIVKDLNLDDTNYAAVSKIVTHKDNVDGTRYYQVRWQNQTAKHDSWLKESDFQDLGPIQDYERNLTKRNSPASQMKGVLDDDGKLKTSVSFADTLEATRRYPRRVHRKSIIVDADD